MKHQDLLSHLLGNLASLAGSMNGRDICGLVAGSKDLQNAGMSLGTPEKVSDIFSNNLHAPLFMVHLLRWMIALIFRILQGLMDNARLYLHSNGQR